LTLGSQGVSQSEIENALIAMVSELDNFSVPIIPVVPNLSSTAPEQPNSSPLDVKIKFNYSVAGLEFGDFVITNATILSLSPVEQTDSKEYILQISPIGPGQVQVLLPAGSVTAGSGADEKSNLSSVVWLRSVVGATP
jgi:hypothetical protein